MTITTSWWWIRHAPVINPGGKIYGQRDVDSDCSESALFADLARRLPVANAVWIVSSLRRTHQTAAALRAAAPHDVENRDAAATPPPVVEPDFAEQNFGDWQGLSHNEVHARFPDESPRFWLAPAHARPPNGESFAELSIRVVSAIERLSAAHSQRHIIAVAHGGVIRAALGEALRTPPEIALRFQIDTLSLTRLDHIVADNGRVAWRVATTNFKNAPHPP